MNKFYDSLTKQERRSAQDVALEYGRTLRPGYERLLSMKAASTSSYYVGLSSEMGSFTDVTKRITLVADTLLLSDHGVGAVHELGESVRPHLHSWVDPRYPEPPPIFTSSRRFGMVTRDLVQLGQWLLEAEPLLRNGLVWYGPVYTTGSEGWSSASLFSSVEVPAGPLPSFEDRSIDFVVEHGRAVDLSTAKPVASRVVRPILEIDLPWLDGLSLSDLAKVTSEEFDSYRQFRTFMRSKLLELDDALEAVNSEVAKKQVALAIQQGVNDVTAELHSATRTRPLSKAVLNLSTAVLTAVQPGAFQSALFAGATILAGTHSVWEVIEAFSDAKSSREQGQWHYVWVLQKKASR